MDARPFQKGQANTVILPQPMVPGTLIKRYKRFLADVALENGEIVTAHCANPSAMTGLAMPGLPVWLSQSTNPNRKLKWSLELVGLESGLVGINTSYPAGVARLVKLRLQIRVHQPELRLRIRPNRTSDSVLPKKLFSDKHVNKCSGRTGRTVGTYDV